MKIFVQSKTGMGPKRYDLDVEPSTTVKQLKRQFLEKINSVQDEEKISFVFDKEILEDGDDTLSSYGVENNSALETFDGSKTSRSDISCLGSKFVDVSNSKDMKKVNWSKSAPLWRKSRRGLCLEGNCTNNTCDAYQRRVVIPIGYKKFDLLTDPDEKTTTCPVCKQYVQPETCGFNNCWWKFEGKKQEAGRPPKPCSSDWIQVDDAYYYFDDNTSEVVTWRQLIIEAVKTKPI
ncbi:hypothetical protein I4U23_003980 [Adineta vaga]|nr:hypothetical protein I4U23_003980 [Adineta vaga]